MAGIAPFRILIVEDEGIIANDIACRLLSAGYEVTGIAVSSEEVLSTLRDSRPDLILMDIRIEGAMDGIQTAAKIRETFDIPIIYLSAHTDRETMGRIGAGGGPILTKPFSSAELVTAIKGTLQRIAPEIGLNV